MIPCIDARDLPQEVSEYLGGMEISTHCRNEVAQVGSDCDEENNKVGGDDLLFNWLNKEYGYEIKNKEWGDYIAIIAT